MLVALSSLVDSSECLHSRMLALKINKSSLSLSVIQVADAGRFFRATVIRIIKLAIYNKTARFDVNEQLGLMRALLTNRSR